MATYFGTGVVWDKDKNKRLCKFVDSKFHTTDEYTKNKLDELGYIADRDDEIVIIEDDHVEELEDELTNLKTYCKEQGYKGYGNCKDVESIKAFIARKEGE